MNNQKILIIDDMKELRIAIKDFLKEAGFKNVLQANSGIEALDIIEYYGHDKFSLILTDLHMPGMNGLDFIKNFKEKYNDNQVKIIMMSSASDISTVYDAVMTGIDDFLIKPFDYEDVKKRMSNVFKVKDQTH